MKFSNKITLSERFNIEEHEEDCTQGRCNQFIYLYSNLYSNDTTNTNISTNTNTIANTNFNIDIDPASEDSRKGD